MKLLIYWINRSTDLTESERETFLNHLAELEEYKQLYNDVAAKLGTANHRLSQIADLAKSQSGLTQHLPDAANICRVVNHVYVDGICAECGSVEPPRR